MRRTIALLVTLTSVGASAATAAPSPAVSAHAAHAASRPATKPSATKSKAKPKTKSSVKKSTAKKSTRKSSKSSARKTSTRKTSTSTTRKQTATVIPKLPALPSLAQLSMIDFTLPGTPSTADAFSLTSSMPVSDAERPLASFSASAERLLGAMVDRARSQLGTRYVFGGNEPGEGLDCSSFARFAMEALGIKLPRTAAQQARIGTAVPRDRAMLKPGDLLTFGRGTRVSHVGIYLGQGRFIHASVKSGQIIETTIERNKRLFRGWLGARRLIAGEADTSAHGDT